MTEHRPRPGGKNGCKPTAFAADLWPPDRVDAPVEAIKAARAEAAFDLLAAQAEGVELTAGHDAMLPFRELSNRPIRMLEPFAPYVGVNTSSISHAAEGGCRYCPRGAQVVPDP